MPDDSGPSTSRSSEDLEKLLSLAEGLQERCDVVERRIEMYRVLQGLLAGGGVLSLLYIVMPHSIVRVSPASTESTTYLFVVATCFAYAAFTEYWLRRIRRRNLPDRVALRRVISLIHETESAVSRYEHWSPLDRAQFQIRLSRLTLAS